LKLFVISDTHKKIQKVKEVFAKLHDVDCIVHLGDYETDAEKLQRELGVRVASVPGNMDGFFDSAAYQILETEYGKLLLTHGHMEQVKVSPLKLLYRAQELGCRAALFGHTHMPFYEESNGIYLINPGSLSQPRDGTQGSYAIITTSPTEFQGSIVYYSSILPSKKSLDGNRLRNLLNNSDRF